MISYISGCNSAAIMTARLGKRFGMMKRSSIRRMIAAASLLLVALGAALPAQAQTWVYEESGWSPARHAGDGDDVMRLRLVFNTENRVFGPLESFTINGVPAIDPLCTEPTGQTGQRVVCSGGLIIPQGTGTSPYTVSAEITYFALGTPVDVSGGWSGTIEYGVPAAPQPTQVLQTSGPAAGGTNVEIMGTYYRNITNVTFGGVPAQSFYAAFGQNGAIGWRLYTVSPPGTPGASVPIKITNAGGTVTAPEQFTYDAPPAPAISSLSASQVPAAGGTQINLSGTNFTGVTGISVGGVPATGIVVNSDTSITFRTPAGSAGTKNIVVTGPGGSATRSNGLAYFDPPTLTASFSPSTIAYNESSTVTVTLTNPADNPAALQGLNLDVYLPGALHRSGFANYNCGGTNFHSVTSSQMTLSISSVEVGASCSISMPVTGNSGTAYTLSDIRVTDYVSTPLNAALVRLVSSPTASLAINPPPVPSLTSVSTAKVPAAGGTQLTLSGSNLTGATGVTIGGQPATDLDVASDTSLSVTLPAGTPGFKTVVVTGPGGSDSLSNAVAYYDPPAVTAEFSTIDPAKTAQGRYYFDLTVSNPAGNPGSLDSARVRVNMPAKLSISSREGTCSVSNSSSSSSFSEATFTDIEAGAACRLRFSVRAAEVGTYTVVTDSITGTPFGAAAPASAQLTHSAPTIAVDWPSDGAKVAAPYSATVTASGGTAPYTYALSAGTLPAGLTLASDGTISGTPTAGGTFTGTVMATDAYTYTGSSDFTLNVGAPTIAFGPQPWTTATRNIAFSETLSATGGIAPYTYAVTAGSLPAGLTLSSSGVLSGTPTSAGNSSFTVTATDSSTGSGPFSGSQSYSLQIVTPAVTFQPTTVPPGVVGVAYNQSITASGGAQPYSFSVSSGSLPAGLTLSSEGVISGTPTSAGDSTFGILATDANSNTGTTTMRIGVTAGGQTISFAGLDNVSVSAESVTLSATASSGLTVSYKSTTPAICTVSGSTVTLVARGTCAITAEQAGDANFSAAASVSRSFLILPPDIATTVQLSTLPAAVGQNLAVTPITVTGGAKPYIYQISPALPAGLSFSSETGEISGTATEGRAAQSYTIRVSDSSGSKPSEASFTLSTAEAVMEVSPDSLTPAVLNAAYSQTVSVSGGTAPYTFSLEGDVPAGLSIDQDTGILSGKPTMAGNFSFTVAATDSSTGTGPYTAKQKYALSVTAPTITLDVAALANGVFDTAYSASIGADGGKAPYRFSVSTGALPEGLTLDANGAISGTPKTAGSFDLTLLATDANTNTGSAAITLTIEKAPQTITFADLESRRLGSEPFALTATASSGLDVAYTSTTVPVCTLEKTGVTLVAVGTCTLEASQAGNETWLAAQPVEKKLRSHRFAPRHDGCQPGRDRGLWHGAHARHSDDRERGHCALYLFDQPGPPRGSDAGR